jgi:N-formylglutamate amidohydrolase
VTERLPVIYTAHHAGIEFGEYSERTLLDETERIAMSDFGTDITVPRNGISTLVATHSRALVDLHRGPDDPARFYERTSPREFGKPIWKPGQQPTPQERNAIHEQIWRPFHEAIHEQLRTTPADKIVVAWDNAGPYKIGNSEAGTEVWMKPFILSNHGREGFGSAHAGESTSCSPELLEILAEKLRTALAHNGLPNEVHLNLVFRGGYIAEHYNTLKHEAELRERGVEGEVHSLMVEYDGSNFTNQDTMEPLGEKPAALRDAFSRAMAETCELVLS